MSQAQDDEGIEELKFLLVTLAITLHCPGMVKPRFINSKNQVQKC